MTDESRDARLERLAAQVKATRQRVEVWVPDTQTQREISRLRAENAAHMAQSEVRIAQNEEMLRQLREMRRRRHGGQTP